MIMEWKFLFKTILLVIPLLLLINIIVYKLSKYKRFTSRHIPKIHFKPTKKQNTFVEDFYRKQKKQSLQSLFAILVYLLSYYTFSIIYKIEIQKNILIYIYIYSLLILFSKLVLYFRIKSGYYGTNYEEARELLYFLININKNDLNSGKKIFNSEKECQELKHAEFRLPYRH